MSIESLTYAEIGDRLGTSAEAARSLARRLRLPRKPGNDGKARVTVDLAEIQYKPLRTRSAGDKRADVDGLNARIEQLQYELARIEEEKRCLEVSAAYHRADFERERKKKPRGWRASFPRPGPVVVGGDGLSRKRPDLRPAGECS